MQPQFSDKKRAHILTRSLQFEYFYRANFVALSIFKKPVLIIGFLVENPLTLLESLEEKGVQVELLEKNAKQRKAIGTLLNLIALIDHELIIEIQRKDGGDHFYLNVIHPVDMNPGDLSSLQVLGELIRLFEQ